MNLVIAYELPFIASKCFEGVIDEELLFKDPSELSEKIDQFLKDDELQHRILKYIKNLKRNVRGAIWLIKHMPYTKR
jgi:hypothetical protein